jgi:hypothetical protein
VTAQIDMPPSTAKVAPVTKELWSLARKSMAGPPRRRRVPGQRHELVEDRGGAVALSTSGGDLDAMLELVADRISDRFGWSLLPVGYLVRRPRG